MARDQGSETHTTKGATNVEKWDTFRTSAKRRKEIKRRETKGRKRDRKITRGRRDRKTNRGPRDSYQHWLCRPSVTWIGENQLPWLRCLESYDSGQASICGLHACDRTNQDRQKTPESYGERNNRCENG